MRKKRVWLQLYRLATEVGVQFEIDDFHIWGGWYRVKIKEIWYDLPEVDGLFKFDKRLYTDLSVCAEPYDLWDTVSEKKVLKTLKEF